MNKILLIILLIALVSCKGQNTSDQGQTSQTVETQVQEQTPSLELNSNIDLGIPQATDTQADIIISRKQYVLSWNYLTHNVNWAAWKLQDKDLGKAKRSNFASDPDLKKYLTEKQLSFVISTNDYTGSCFNRGHVVPSADRNSTPEENRTTFYMSNMTPQTAWLNQTSWGHLENVERDLAKSGKTLYIYSGPIYDNERGGIGPRADIKIPSKFFKIIVILDSDKELTVDKNTQMIVVIMPNKTSANTWPDEDRKTLCDDSKKLPSRPANLNDWKDYQTTLEDVEEQSGLRFFESNDTQVLAPVIFGV